MSRVAVGTTVSLGAGDAAVARVFAGGLFGCSAADAGGSGGDAGRAESADAAEPPEVVTPARGARVTSSFAGATSIPNRTTVAAPRIQSRPDVLDRMCRNTF